MSLNLDTKTLAQLLTTALGSSVMGAWLNHFLARRREIAREPADLIRAMGEASDSLSEGAKTLMEAFIKEFTFLREQITGLREQLKTAETAAKKAAEQARQNADKHAECERRVENLQEQIDEMMKGPVAKWSDPAPKGDGI